MLVVGDLYQLPPVNARPIYAASLDFEHPTSYVMKDLWELFKIVELDEVMREKEDKFFKDVLKKICVGDFDNNIVKVLKSRFVNLDIIIIQNRRCMFLQKMDLCQLII